MLLYLDPYLLGDPLFATALARDLAARREGLVLVHSAGEAGERALEGLGAWPERDEGGVWRVAGDREAAAVERATRDLNRRLVHELNEAGVPTVGVMGADRGLLKAGSDGVAAGRTEWLRTLVAQGGVPVVALLAARGDGPLREVAAPDALAALSRGTGWPVGVLVTGRAAPAPDADLGALHGRLAEPATAAALVRAGVPVRALAAPAIRAAGLPEGAWLGAERPKS